MVTRSRLSHRGAVASAGLGMYDDQAKLKRLRLALKAAGDAETPAQSRAHFMKVGVLRSDGSLSPMGATVFAWRRTRNVGATKSFRALKSRMKLIDRGRRPEAPAHKYARQA